MLISLVSHVLRFLTVFPQLLLCLDTHLTRLPDLTSSACPPPVPTSHPISWPWPFPAQAQAVSTFCTFAPSVPFGWNALCSLLQAHALCLQGWSNMASWGSAPGHVQVAKDSPPGSRGMHVLSPDPSVSPSSPQDLVAQRMAVSHTSPAQEWRQICSLPLQYFGGGFPGNEGCGQLGYVHSQFPGTLTSAVLHQSCSSGEGSLLH